MSDSTDISIPAMVDLVDGVWQDGFTYTVTAITDGSVNSGVFYDSGITSVTFPLSLTSIGNYAFRGCSGLTSISLPSSLTSIGNGAFYYCTKFTSVDLSNCTSLTSIGDSAFYYCTKLTSVDLSNCTNLTSIGRDAFQYCSGLTSVDLSGCTNLTSIGSWAFNGCSALKSVVFPVGSTGWEVSTSSSMTNPRSVSVTDPSTNASNLTGQYSTYYWKRNA